MALITTTLAAACTADATTIRVTSATGFRPQQLIQIDGELLVQNGAGSTGTTISVRRAVEGTIPAAHGRGAAVQSGTGADFAAPPPGEIVMPPAGVDVVRQASLTLTNAQIKSLPVTGVEIIPAPGPYGPNPQGRALVPFASKVVVAFNWAADYTNVTAGSVFRLYLNGWTGAVEWRLTPKGGLPLFFSYGASLLWQVNEDQVTSTAAENDFTTQVNAPLLIDIGGNSGALTGGHANNTLIVTVLYTVYDTVRKAYI